ncbi:MAG: FAD/NAD(P)-binding protein [Planctomycetaceae bacterium]|nr:FAD/NAD(P)-binding protein [Planctomycetaceae bacterium]
MPCMTMSSFWQPVSMRIEGIQTEIDGVFTYDLRFTKSADRTSYHFEPGQFNMLYLPGVGEAAISLSGDRMAESVWRHTVRVAGRVTHTLSRCRVGDTLGVRGPFGQGWPIDAWVGDDIVLVAGGIGLAPMRPVIYEFLRRRAEFGQITLIHGARTPETLLYSTEHAGWERGGIVVQATVDRASSTWRGHQGVVTLLLDRLSIARPQRTHVAMCGPEIMMRYAAISAARRGISDERMWVSLERNMQCAAGLCGHCQLGPMFVCKDGPVFRADRVHSLLAVEAL